MRAELLTVGSELLNGSTLNTNAAYLCRRLQETGCLVLRQTAVGDDRVQIAAAVREALARSELVVVTGGLGPTFDDMTMVAVSDATGRPLRFDPIVARRIRRFYRAHHRAVQNAALRQALLPGGGLALPNPLGTAPGLWLALDGCRLVALPGVPREMRAMTEQAVVPRLRRATRGHAIATLRVRTSGLVELQIEQMLRRLTIPDGVEIGLYPHLRLVDVRLTAAAASRQAARQAVARVAARLHRRLGAAVYAVGDDELEGVVGRLLVRRRQTLAVAESCTGGLIADRLTDVPGSSRYFLGGVVAYHNDIKRHSLGVSAKLLRRHGAVSAQVAAAMARGVKRALGADVGLGVTGIAGPTGGTPRKPVGLVYLGVAIGRAVSVRRFQFIGDREQIKLQATQAALDDLRRSLR